MGFHSITKSAPSLIQSKNNPEKRQYTQKSDCIMNIILLMTSNTKLPSSCNLSTPPSRERNSRRLIGRESFFCNPKTMTHQRTINEYWNHHTEVSTRIGHSYSFKISLNRLLRNYKGKNGTFTMKKSGGHQVIKVNITNNGINWQHVPPDVMHWGHNITYVLFLPKMHNLKLVMRKQ